MAFFFALPFIISSCDQDYMMAEVSVEQKTDLEFRPMPVDTVIKIQIDSIGFEVEIEIEVRDTVLINTNFSGFRYGTEQIIGQHLAAVPEFHFEDGQLVGTELCLSKFDASVSAGEPILCSEAPVLKNETPEISGNNFFFNYGSFKDLWNVKFQRDVVFNGIAKDTTFSRSLAFPYTAQSIAFYQEDELTWVNKGALLINNIIQDIDEQVLFMEKPEYNLVVSHKQASVNPATMLITDTHSASLVEKGKVVESNTYDATHKVSFTQSSKIKFEDAKNLEHQSFPITEGKVKVNNITFTIDVQTTNCNVVVMNTNSTTYCHPAFPVDGAVTALSCCSLEGKTLKTSSITGNQLPGEIIVGDNDGDNIPVTIPIIIEVTPRVDVHGVEFADGAEVTGPNSSTLIAYPTINGVRTGEEVKLTSSFSGSLVAGAQINKTSNGSVNLSSTNAKISGNSATFTYTLDGSNFADAWSWNTQANATFTYNKNGVKETVTRPIKADVAVKSTSFTGTNGTYRNTASLYADGFAIASDTQVIVVNKPDVHGVEFADGAEVTGPNSSTLIAYPTINGVRTGEEVKLTSSFSGSLVAGAQINKTSNGSVNLSSTNAKISGNSATFTYTLDGSNFADAWSWNTQANATFTYNKNGVKETVTRPIKADVAVKSTSFTGTNGTYRNTASLYADGFAIASDTQVIVVNKPQASLIDGYTVIGAYVTTCYHKGSNDDLVSDGNQMAIVARKNNDASKYIIRRANATTGEKIEDYNVNNVDESKIFSFRTVEGKLKPAYIDVIRVDNKAASWAYQDISSFNPNDINTYFAVSKWYVINYRLTDPLIEVGKVENGGVSINGKFFK